MPLFSRTQGNPQNQTLVFLHGFLGNVNDWSETIKYLKDEFYCVSIDLPGHGNSLSQSPPTEGGFDYCHHLIKDTLNELQINSFTLIGYSLGGRIALDYVRTQNDGDLQKLVLESCHTGLTQSIDKEQRYQQDLGWATRFATQSMYDTLDEWYEQSVFSSMNDLEKERVISKRSDNYGVYLAKMLLSTSLSKQADALPFLRENKTKNMPISIYYCFGQKDHKFKKLATELSAQTAIPLKEFNGAGHNIHQQVPLQYAQFIKQLFE